MASWASEEVMPDPKPERRIRASQAEWSDIHKHFEHAACVATGLPHQHLHHIAFRKADNGDDLVVNLAPLTMEAHERFHKRAPGWERVAASIRQYVITNPERLRYIEEKMGDKFGRRYPPLPTSDRRSDWDKYEEPVWRIRPYEEEESESVEGSWA